MLPQKKGSLNEAIAELLAQENVEQLLRNRRVRTVDFGPRPLRDDSGTRYTIQLSAELSTPSPVVCAFRRVPAGSKRILWSSSYFRLASFNKELNSRLLASIEQPEVAIAYGNTVYDCIGVTGTLYVVWSVAVQRVNAGNRANAPLQNVPLVINCDGELRIKGIFMLEPDMEQPHVRLLPHAQGNPIIQYPGSAIFVCDVPAPPPPRAPIATLSRAEAEQQLLTLAQDPRVWMPYEHKVDVMEDDDDGDAVSWSRGEDAPMQPALSIFREGKPARDPFEEDVYEGSVI